MLHAMTIIDAAIYLRKRFYVVVLKATKARI
jgi:hypothetical protein